MQKPDAGECRDRPRPEHERARPPPLATLDEAEREQRDRDSQKQRAEQIGRGAPSGCPALDERPFRRDHRGDADGHVDEEHEPPVGDLDQQSTDRRPQPRSDGGGRTPQRHGPRSTAGSEGMEHEPERGGDDHGCSERLQAAGGDQEPERRRDRAGDRADGEDHDPQLEESLPTQQIGDPAGGNEKRRKDEVVGVQYPGERRDRAVVERRLDVRERDVDDGGVQKRQHRAERRDAQHGTGLDRTPPDHGTGRHGGALSRRIRAQQVAYCFEAPSPERAAYAEKRPTGRDG